MAWWGYSAIGIAIFLAVRWVMVTRALKEQEPSALALQKAHPIILHVKTLLDYIEQNPNIAEDEREDFMGQLNYCKQRLISLLRDGVDSGGLVYLRSFLDYTDVVIDYYQSAPFNVANQDDRSRLAELAKRLEELNRRGQVIRNRNPTPSFFRMLILGVPKVQPID